MAGKKGKPSFQDRQRQADLVPICKRCGKDDWYEYPRKKPRKDGTIAIDRTCRPCVLQRQKDKRVGREPRPFPPGTCVKCGVPVNGTGRDKSWCKPCYNKHRQSRWREIKTAEVDRRGGACVRCGWRPSSPREYAALEFHHIDPTKKEYQVASVWLARAERREAELEKCEMICANCHRIHHATEWES